MRKTGARDRGEIRQEGGQDLAGPHVHPRGHRVGQGTEHQTIHIAKREEAGIMKKEKKAFKGWIDPMATPYQYKKG